MDSYFTPEIEKILNLIPKKDRPFSRLEKGKPLAKGKEAIASSGQEPLVQAALYLYFDCFDEAHDIANAHEGSVAGNWVHAILHRREPDASNSKYWYARVKWPPEVVRQIIGEMIQLKDNQHFQTWEPGAYVDACEVARKKSPKDSNTQTLAQIQEIEWRALLKFVLTL